MIINKDMLEQFYYKIKELNLLKEKIISFEDSNSSNIGDYDKLFDKSSFIKKYYEYNYKGKAITLDILKEIWVDGLCAIESELILIEQFIRSIESSEIRQIIRYKYLENYTWNKTAQKIYGLPCGDRARKKVDRFFKNKI